MSIKSWFARRSREKTLSIVDEILGALRAVCAEVPKPPGAERLELWREGEEITKLANVQTIAALQRQLYRLLWAPWFGPDDLEQMIGEDEPVPFKRAVYTVLTIANECKRHPDPIAEGDAVAWESIALVEHKGDRTGLCSSCGEMVWYSDGHCGHCGRKLEGENAD